MSHRVPVLFAAFAAVISIGVMIQEACRSQATATPGGRAPTALHHPGPGGGQR